MTQSVREVVLEWADIKETFLSVYEGGMTGDYYFDSRHSYEYRKGYKTGNWYADGETGDDMYRHVTQGFKSEHFPVSDAYVPKANERHIVWSDEGELDIPMALSGMDYPYMRWTEHDTKPGLKVVAGFQFSAGVQPEYIAQYGAWIAGVLSGMEQDGYDIELDLRICMGNMTRESKGTSHIYIRVKRENELSDFSEWSSLFSPGGWRILAFIGLAIGAKGMGEHLQSGMGHPIGSNKVEYQEEGSTLFIDVDSRGTGTFPAASMTEQVTSVLNF